MLCIRNLNTNPYFNLAAEEYVLKNFDDNCFMLWRNAPAIIVGKHQNTLAEINVDYVKKHEIKVVRRLSGGGAVFHDLGNLNFTFIHSGDTEKLIDFKKYTKPIIDVLHNLGIPARFEGRNDLTIDGRKFSGNAEHIFRNKILHHGTLLFSSKMSDLSEALRINEVKYRDKSVKSVRSRVTNISDHLEKPMEVMEFYERIMEHIMEMYEDAELYELTENDKNNINQLVEEKYNTWEWNFGYSPKYNFQKIIRTEGGSLEINLEVDKGIIRKAKIFGDFFNKRNVTEIEAALIDVKHSEDEVKQRLQAFHLNDYFTNIPLDEILKAMF